MQLDNIVVICLALLFFGGIGYLAFKDRKQEGNKQETIEPEVEQITETPVSPKADNGAKEGRKKRRKRRNR
jgi:hypothetical protein